MTKKRFTSALFAFYLLLSTTFFLYSYGFVDLNLTLTSQPTILTLISRLQQLVYFNRADSATLYFAFVVLFALLYFLILKNAAKHKQFPFKPVLAIALIFTFAYPLFSHDIYNYMFHSKIIWHYHANPHVYPPLHFEGDPWLRFMRWVHTSAAYGPGHTLLYSPVYLLGLGKFTLTLFWAKLIPLGAYLGSILLVGKLARLQKANSPVLLQLAFALNPYILIDSLANSHNDLVMMAFYLLALYLLLRGKVFSSVLTLLYSVTIKLMTVVFLPFYFLRRYFSTQQLLLATSVLLYLPLLLWLDKFQPWYLVWFYLAALLIRSQITFIFATFTTILSLFYYYPFVATGFWNNSRSFTFLLVFAAPLTYLAVASLRSLRR